MGHVFYFVSFVTFLAVGAIALAWPPALWSLALLGPIFLQGLRDRWQKQHAVLRNFPLIGHFRYLLELIRPEINQYFIESNVDGRPYNREQRDVAYQRAKKVRDTIPFGTQRNVYELGYEWINHSLAARSAPPGARVTIGGETCEKPYDASLLNISAMSFGSLSGAAIRALNEGAGRGGFYHNTGEGSISGHHLSGDGDLVWQIGTGYFGCRDKGGNFDPEPFRRRATLDQVKMIEIKLSQGAKPGHGGILPAVKITKEIARIRDVPLDEDVLSPPAHSVFEGPRGLLRFVRDLREISGGKPVGIKLCVGTPSEFLGLCMAMHETGLVPDFITVDGGEGGTGAAPVEFSNRIGSPLTDGLVVVQNALVGFGLRDKIKVIASGKILSGFDIAARLAVGADLCNSARGFMFALGCIQARRCNANVCPVGVATQDPQLTRGLVVSDKATRVFHFHEGSLEAFMAILGAAGLEHQDELRPWHVFRRTSLTQVQTYDEIYDYLTPGALLAESVPEKWSAWMRRASPETFLSPRTIETRESREALN